VQNSYTFLTIFEGENLVFQGFIHQDDLKHKKC